MIGRVLGFVLIAVLVSLGQPDARAQTFRWASQGDVLTMDPHGQNNSFTNSVNSLVYETLVTRDKLLKLVPALATEWKQLSPVLWRFKLRSGVKFHDGTTLTADDVVFSIKRAQDPISPHFNYANALGEPRKIDELTVEFATPVFNPVFLEHASLIFIMSKEWCEKNKTARVQNFKDREETYAASNANGTGPYLLTSRAPGTRTTHRRNPHWWDKHEGNIQEAVLTPISNDATRLAALVSGELEFVLDPAPRDVPRLRNTSGIKLLDGTENRLIFIAMDQGRDKLLYGKVPGDKNPFKDLRVRKALYQAIDIETMRTKVMNGLSAPTGGYIPTTGGPLNDAELESRLPFSLVEARKLMEEAGYANGFEVTLDCPNARYVNDEEICLTLAAMWAKINIKVKVNAMTPTVFFPKLEKIDTSLYMYGWGGSTSDPNFILTPVMRGRGEKGIGVSNFGDWRNEKFDALVARSVGEVDVVKRQQLIRAALVEWKEQVQSIPLHRQVIPWAMRDGVKVVHRADNYLRLDWVSIAIK